MSGSIDHPILVAYLGHTSFDACWNLQQEIFGQRLTGRIADVLLLTEHGHVYTLGKNGDEKHLIADRSELAQAGIAVVHIDRGGDITYHGPGQIVGYPILDLSVLLKDLDRYLRAIETIVIRSLARFGVQGSRISGHTGVWVGDRKICAIGIKTSRWITMHGFALNVNTDLSYFEKIVPCGISDKGVTSIEQCVGKPLLMQDVTDVVVDEFVLFFGARAERVERDSFFRHRTRTDIQPEWTTGERRQTHENYEVTE